MELTDRYAAIDVVGIDEEIGCEMCRNPMHTDRGCDGGCTYDEKLYERIMHVLDERIRPLPSVQPEDKCGECDAWNKYKNYPSGQRCVMDLIGKQTPFN